MTTIHTFFWIKKVKLKRRKGELQQGKEQLYYHKIQDTETITLRMQQGCQISLHIGNGNSHETTMGQTTVRIIHEEIMSVHVNK